MKETYFLIVFRKVKPSAEPLHPTSTIDESTPGPSVERVAFGTDLYTQIFPRRTRLEAFATGAGDNGFIIRGMNIGFHLRTSPREKVPINKAFMTAARTTEIL